MTGKEYNIEQLIQKAHPTVADRLAYLRGMIKTGFNEIRDSLKCRYDDEQIFSFYSDHKSNPKPLALGRLIEPGRFDAKSFCEIIALCKYADVGHWLDKLSGAEQLSIDLMGRIALSIVIATKLSDVAKNGMPEEQEAQAEKIRNMAINIGKNHSYRVCGGNNAGDKKRKAAKPRRDKIRDEAIGIWKNEKTELSTSSVATILSPKYGLSVGHIATLIKDLNPHPHQKKKNK